MRTFVFGAFLLLTAVTWLLSLAFGGYPAWVALTRAGYGTYRSVFTANWIWMGVLAAVIAMVKSMVERYLPEDQFIVSLRKFSCAAALASTTALVLAFTANIFLFILFNEDYLWGYYATAERWFYGFVAIAFFALESVIAGKKLLKQKVPLGFSVDMAVTLLETVIGLALLIPLSSMVVGFSIEFFGISADWYRPGLSERWFAPVISVLAIVMGVGLIGDSFSPASQTGPGSNPSGVNPWPGPDDGGGGPPNPTPTKKAIPVDRRPRKFGGRPIEQIGNDADFAWRKAA